LTQLINSLPTISTNINGDYFIVCNDDIYSVIIINFSNSSGFTKHQIDLVGGIKDPYTIQISNGLFSLDWKPDEIFTYLMDPDNKTDIQLNNPITKFK